jgi:hypothetical protein
MKPSLRALALSVVVCLTLACATVTNPQVLLGGRATPTLPADINFSTPEIDTSAPSQLATELAGTLEASGAGSPEGESTPEAGSTPEGGDSSPSAMGTSIAATLEAITGGATLPALPTAAPGQAKTPVAPKIDANAGIRVTDSLNLLVGQQSGSEALPSFHLEVKQVSPVMSSGALAQTEEQIVADVEGANVHFTDTTTKPGGQPVATEAYIIGQDNYTVKNGKASPDFGLSSVAWSTWPINAEIVLGLGSLKTVSAGTDTIEDRKVEVYTIGGTAADDPTGALSGMGLPVTNVKGQVWVDQKTGVLLKAVLDYKAMALDSGSPTQTSGPGHLEITVTQIGQVTVKDPTK